MDGISSEMTEEKDNITRPVRRRHSSILKPPRSPLQDLRSGNETVQESSTLRNRKSSRRVSFADTIKVFQTESHMTTVRKSEITETEARENILNIQNKDSDDNYCEITGMDTLLCAPIQIQQKELSFIEHNYERKQANDQTVIFSDGNQMDLTASHTVLITKGLLDYSASEKSMKIDTTSFLANLKHNAETSTMKNELKCSMSQNTSPAKKINWNDFITRLKTGKYLASSTGPDKENSEMLTYSKESNSTASTHQMHVSANVDENGSNRTRIFSEQDDGMNFTQCHTGNIQTLVPPFSNANLGELKGDITIYGNECMDLTTNHVIQVLPSATNISEKENQTQNVMMDVATVCEAKAPEKKSVLKDKLNAAFQDSFLNPQHITRSHIMGSETCTVPQTCKQDARTLAMTSESLCSSQVIQCDKTAFFSSYNDAMEVTMCLSGMAEEKALLKHDGNYSKTCPNPDASPLPTEKTIYSGEDSMDITKSHTVAIDNNIFKQDQPNTKKEIAISISGKEVMFQNQITVPENGKMNISCISVPQVSKERLLQNPMNSLPISDKKTKLLAGDCMDLTESYISNLRSRTPLESCDLAPENITKSHSKSLSDEWEKMTKSLIQPTQQPDKHILTDTQSKEKHQVLKISSCLDKDSPPVHYNEDTTTNYNRAHCGELGKQVVVGHKEQGQHSELPEPQKKNLNEPTLDCFHDKIICSEEEQTMDLTKSHTVVIGFGPSEVQEPSDTNLGHRTSKHTTVSSQIAVNVEKCDKNAPGKARVIITNDMAEVEDRTQKLGFLKEKQNINKICRRKSVGGLKIDKTIVFSEGNGNDMDITKSYTVEINHRPVLDKHDSELMLLAGTSKTALYACGQDDMEITRSHSSVSDCRNVSPHEKTSRPLDKTVMFVDDHDELEMTKSHTVFIDYQAEDKTVLPDRLNLEQSKRKSLREPKVTSAPAEESVSFSENNESVRVAAKGSQLSMLEEESSNRPRKEADDLEVTKSHTVFIDCQATEILREYPKFEIATGKNLNHSCAQEIIKKQTAVEQKHLMTMLIPTHTLSGEQNKTEIIKCHRTDIEEKVTGKDQVCVLEEAKTESCHLNSTERRNVHLTTSHIDAVCGSSDNYFCLPNVTTSDNLEGNSISFADKNKEKANNCQVKNELINVDNLASGYCIVSERLPLFASCPLKEEIQTTSTQHLDSVITVPTDQDMMKGPQNQTLVCSQNLEEMAKVNKRVSFKLPNEQVNVFVDDICVASQPHLLTQQLQPLIQKGQNIVNKDEMTLSNAGNKTSAFLIEKSSTPTCEKESKILSNEKHLIVSHKKELKESIQKAKCNTSVDCISNLDLTTQVIQTLANDGKASESTVISNVPGSSIVRPSLNNFNGKTEEILDFQAVQLLPPSDQLLELEDKTHNNMRVQAIETHDIVSNDVKDKRDEETHTGVGTTAVPPKRAVKDKMRRCSLGIFLPKLPNKRNCSVTGTDDLEQIPADLNYLENQPVSSKDSGIGSIVAKLNLSPSQYINEENLPIYPGEINSLDSISTEIEEKALTEISHKEILPFENKMEETCNIQKRTWVQEDDDVPAEKKVRKADTTQEKEIFDYHTEEDNDKNVNSVLIKSLSRTPSSCSSSLDSIKADGTSLDFSTHRNSQMESQFLDDTIGEENLREKLKDGRITIKEFFILLQVHILIQKPRQSNLPAKFTINTSPIPEDLMLRQYVYGPKIQIYREDCEILRQKIEELKVSALNQDKLLTDVNRNLWEKMRHCSDEELKTFGIYLNKIKSSYTKMTKVFTHQGKVALYSKLVHSAQNEKEKLQIRINEMDSILKKINNCLTEVEMETKNLENEEKHNPTEEWDSEMRIAEEELEQLKIEEEELQRKLLEVEIQKEQALSRIQFTQKQVHETEELLDHLSLSEWNGIEWSDDQAVFTFVYDSIELTILFGEPVVGVPFLDKTCRAIAELNFQSILDEDKAPPSSLLVHKLIFQYIEKQESWKKKCITQHQVPQMLQELSLVVNHCRLLGEEIEFLKRWGPNYNLMNIDINDTKLKLLFSSYAAFVKFEITFSLSAHYPLTPLPFTIQSHIGNTDHNEIATIISKVPFEDNYLKNVVKQIYQDLLKIYH
uniref:kinetochore scaffold 1 isoform X2 n=1 Tax=Jaculus jaculus TaxID=51337 RepID=UPI001E1B1E46|nr:kinetochore scaffold 1 isoform X2 [Jaculus jaculus]